MFRQLPKHSLGDIEARRGKLSDELKIVHSRLNESLTFNLSRRQKCSAVAARRPRNGVLCEKYLPLVAVVFFGAWRGLPNGSTEGSSGAGSDRTRVVASCGAARHGCAGVHSGR